MTQRRSLFKNVCAEFQLISYNLSIVPYLYVNWFLFYVLSRISKHVFFVFLNFNFIHCLSLARKALLPNFKSLHYFGSLLGFIVIWCDFSSQRTIDTVKLRVWGYGHDPIINEYRIKKFIQLEIEFSANQSNEILIELSFGSCAKWMFF